MADGSLQFMGRHMAHKLLTREEEVVLAKGIEAGDVAARSRMIECNMRLVPGVRL